MAEQRTGCGDGPVDCPWRRAWFAYDADRWMRSLPAGVFPGTMDRAPVRQPAKRCTACPRKGGEDG